MEVSVTRNYGETANDKAMKLIQKLIFATLAVVVLVFFALGLRRRRSSACRDADAGGHPVCLLGLGLHAQPRVLFALIFSIGILVDDAIVVVENIHRHRELHPGNRWPRSFRAAVDEVGGPTILAAFTVIAALAADGLCDRPDRAVHEPDSDQCQHGHGDFAGDCVQRHALAGAPVF